jgi:hypothetical protein
MQPQVIASLEPGKTYVIKMHARFRTKEEQEAFMADLRSQAPECKFLMLPREADILTAIPAVANSWTLFCACSMPVENMGYCSTCGYKLSPDPGHSVRV